MSEFYTANQIDAQAAITGNRIAARTSSSAIVARINEASDANLITDAERAAISNIPPEKYKGPYVSLAALASAHPTATPGDYATLTKAGDDTNAIWDEGAGAWIDTEVAVSSETAGSVKTKYESNANTNAFTDAEKTKLANITEAADISSFTAALDGALA